jgi:ribosomal protein S12 methylthiotransferase
MKERLVELEELQEGITAANRRALVGARIEVLVDGPGVGRSHRETPEIDGIVEVPEALAPGTFHDVTVTAAFGPDLVAVAE